MHIHLPKEGFKSFRGFLKEMFIITCGVLIALSLEGIRHSMHQRHLVKEARANILTEVRENRADAARTLAKIPGHLTGMRNYIGRIHAARARRGSVENSATKLGYGLPSLSRLSWGAAQSTGAVSFMSYQEVKRYKSIYENQELVEQTNRKMWDQWDKVASVIARVDVYKDFDSISNEDLAQDERLLIEFLVSLKSQEGITKTLIKSYDDFLATQGK